MGRAGADSNQRAEAEAEAEAWLREDASGLNFGRGLELEGGSAASDAANDADAAAARAARAYSGGLAMDHEI